MAACIATPITNMFFIQAYESQNISRASSPCAVCGAQGPSYVGFLWQVRGPCLGAPQTVRPLFLERYWNADVSIGHSSPVAVATLLPGHTLACSGVHGHQGVAKTPVGCGTGVSTSVEGPHAAAGFVVGACLKATGGGKAAVCTGLADAISESGLPCVCALRVADGGVAGVASCPVSLRRATIDGSCPALLLPRSRPGTSMLESSLRVGGGVVAANAPGC